MFKTFSIVFLTVLVSLGRGFVALGSPLEIDPEANRLGDFNQGPAKLSQEIQLQIENLTREALRERDLKEEFHSLSPLLGHNLTATTDTPKQGHWLLGDYAIAYGITDQLMVGLNPWITINYNMSAAGIKYALDRGSYFQNLLDRVSFEIYYFKTYQILFDGYHQSSWFTRLSGTQMLASNYRLHGSISFQYFYDSLAPFSLRPPPIGDSPVTLSAGLLHEIHVTEKTGFLSRMGFWVLTTRIVTCKWVCQGSIKILGVIFS